MGSAQVFLVKILNEKKFSVVSLSKQLNKTFSPLTGKWKQKEEREEKLNSFGLESHIFKCLKSTDILHFNQTKRDIYKTVTNYLNQTNQNGTFLTNKC